MTSAIQSATTASPQATKSVKIPGFWDRLVIKFCALFSGADSKPFDKIADQFSQGYKPWDKAINPLTVKGIEAREVAYKAAIKEIDAHPTQQLSDLHGKIKLKEAEVSSLKGGLESINRAEEEERDYYHGSCYTDDYPQQRSKAEAAIHVASFELSSLQSDLHTERLEIARDEKIVIPKSRGLKSEVRTTANLYRRVSSNIIQAQAKQPTLSIRDVAVLSMPLFLSDTEQKNLEGFLQDAQ